MPKKNIIGGERRDSNDVLEVKFPYDDTVVDSVYDAVAIINDSPYGLQAGLFTNDIKRIMDAWDRIDVGGLQVNSVSTFHVDHMPYDGIKASGYGREGIKYAIEDMTELRLMVLNLG